MSSRAIIIPAAERIKSGRLGVLSFSIDNMLRDSLIHLIEYQESVRRSPSPYYTVKIDIPRKPRTIGYKSQNHHINGHCQQIAMETGQPFEDVKKYAKQLAVSMGYPILEDENGPVMDLWNKVQGISECDCSTEEAAILIDAVHTLAATLDIRLIEED